MKLNLRGVDLNLLTIFEAIIATGRMSKAAAELGMTQPAASHALKRLRHTFGDELFVRTREGMKPTPRALEIAPAVTEALEIIRSAVEGSAQFDPARSDRRFKIAFGRYGELSVLPSLLNRINEVSTEITVQSILDKQETGLALVQEGDIDFCLDFVEPDGPHLEYQVFDQEELVVIARRDHPRITTDKITLKQFFAEKHIVMTFGGDRRGFLQRFMAQKGGSRKIMAEVNQYIAAPTVVMQTDGIAMVPRELASFYLYNEGIRILPLPFKLPPIPTYLMWHKSRNRDKGHQWLKGLLLAIKPQ